MGSEKSAIAIVDYGVGNIASLVNMLEYVDSYPRLISEPSEIARASAILLPGVGSFAHAMAVLRSRGIDEAIKEAASNGATIFGVCLGMQLLARHSEEGNCGGLGLLNADVRKIVPSHGSIKVPHMGWCEVQAKRRTWMLPGDAPPDRFYFAHSYHMVCDNPADIAGIIEYDGVKTIAVECGAVCGVQFHPEKSHRFGMRLLADFVKSVA